MGKLLVSTVCWLLMLFTWSMVLLTIAGMRP
jgi:hypothetical protein